MPSLATPATRERKVLRINAVYERRQAHGFPVTLEGNAETLQVARERDGINWLTVKGICDEGIAQGQGDEPGLIFLQATSNNRYFMSFNEAASIIRDLRAWGIASWANWNRLKDLARAARFSAELEAIDPEEGWP